MNNNNNNNFRNKNNRIMELIIYRENSEEKLGFFVGGFRV